LYQNDVIILLSCAVKKQITQREESIKPGVAI